MEYLNPKVALAKPVSPSKTQEELSESIMRHSMYEKQIYRWQEFKLSRAYQIEKFMALKRQRIKIRNILYLVELFRHVRHIKANYDVLAFNKKKRNASLFMSLKLKYVWRKILRHNRGQVDNIFRNRVRSVLTLACFLKS